MKRFFAGIVMGVILTMAVPVIANTNMGKPVEGTFPVYLYGNKLAKDAVVIDSTSYLPVRALGEALSLDVRFENNQVMLERKQDNDGKKHLDYKIMSNKVIVKTPEQYYEKNGEIYVLAGQTFGNDKCSLDENGNWVVTLSGRPPAKAFIEGSRIWIGISDLGLKAVIRDGVMWLE